MITKRGRPVARLTPLPPQLGEWFGRDRDIIRVHGDIGAPVDVEWEPESDSDRVLNPWLFTMRKFAGQLACASTRLEAIA